MGFSLFNIFGSNKNSRKEASGDNLSSTVKINKVLQHLIDDRTLLTAKIPGADETYTSAVIEIKPKNHSFILDELNPPEGHSLFIKKKTLNINGQSRGALFSFQVNLLDTGSSKGIAYYEVSIPATMDYVQRRAYYRARVTGNQRITVTTFHKESDSSISGYVIDVSTHGISILFNTTRSVQRGDILTRCHMSMPDGQKVTFDLDIKHSQRLANERIRVGASFYDINTMNLRLIEKFVRKVERDALKKG